MYIHTTTLHEYVNLKGQEWHNIVAIHLTQEKYYIYCRGKFIALCRTKSNLHWMFLNLTMDPNSPDDTIFIKFVSLLRVGRRLHSL